MLAKGAGASVLLTVIARPGSNSDEVIVENGVVTVRVRARAIEGAANDAVVATLAGRLGLAKSRVQIERGERSRQKRVRILGLEKRAVAGALGLA